MAPEGNTPPRSARMIAMCPPRLFVLGLALVPLLVLVMWWLG
jgi:hypothetical protein